MRNLANWSKGPIGPRLHGFQRLGNRSIWTNWTNIATERIAYWTQVLTGAVNVRGRGPMSAKIGPDGPPRSAANAATPWGCTE